MAGGCCSWLPFFNRSMVELPITLPQDHTLFVILRRGSSAWHEKAEILAEGVDDFVLVWLGVGLGLAIVLNGRLHHGSTGAAGEIGYLPVPGASDHGAVLVRIDQPETTWGGTAAAPALSAMFQDIFAYERIAPA